MDYNVYEGLDLVVKPVIKKSTKKRDVKPLVAKKTCRVNLDDCIVELVKGQEVHGLKRQERAHLVFHDLAE